MTRRNTLLIVASAILLAGFGWSFYATRTAVAEPLTLRFHAFVGDQPLVLNEMRYNNPGGEGRYKIRDFQLFISNIQLSGPSKSHTAKDSYHLLRFDGESAYAEITLPALDIDDFDEIHWGIGIDPKANGSLVIAGDLDPNNRMAWNWKVGYKFILLEGRLDTGQNLVPLVYHVGFDENYTPQSLPIVNSKAGQQGTVLNYKIDINALFAGPPPLDMAAVPTVKFDPDDTQLIAQGFKGLITN